MTEPVTELLQALSKTKVYDLGQPYWTGMPVHPADPPFQYFLYRYHEHTKKLFETLAPGFADSIGLVVSSMHAGTHFDAPIHMSRDLKVLGRNITEYEGHSGYANLPDDLESIDKVRPVGRKCVLLDVPAHKSLEILPERYEITGDDLEETSNKQGTKIEQGDCVLVRTGYSRFFTKDADAYLHKFAGLGAKGAKWLAKKKPHLIGIDNLAAGVPKPFEVHNIILTDNGIFLMKSLNLEELARDKKLNSVLVVSPLKIKGGEASLIRPIAIA